MLLHEQSDEWPRFHEQSLFESAVMAISDHVQVEREMAIPSALGAMATACQGVIDIELPGGHSIPSSLMLLTVAGSGERKTSIENKFFSPVIDFYKEGIKHNHLLKRQYTRELQTWRDKEKIIRKRINNAFSNEEPTHNFEDALKIHDDTKPPEPLYLHLVYKDATPSALALGLYKNLPIACLLSSEAGYIFNGKTFEQLSLFNELWSGSSISHDRITTESFYLDNARLTASLMIQPDVINDFLKKRGKIAFGSGFLARFLIAFPRSKAGFRDKVPASLNSRDIEPFYIRVKELLKESLDIFRDKKPRQLLRFSRSAQSRWVELNEIIEHQSRQDQLFSHAQDHASKLMEQVSRIAGIIHAFEKQEGDISIETLEHSFNLTMCFSRDYLRSIVGPREIEALANRIVMDIRKYAAKIYTDHYTFVRSTLSQKTHPALREKEKMLEVLKFLERLGHLNLTHDGKTYEFKETILSSHEPELKNGRIYYVEELPKFDDQEIISPGSGYLAKRQYRMKPNLSS
ncbi:YfjI family protein [Salinicola halophyticus]|uniref:YfjI family protein n=1 Tax=Salinicola halophyticus TaxID=1808881 RepID=UPI003F4655C4